LLTLVMKKVASIQSKRLQDKMPVNNTTSANVSNELQADHRQLCEQNPQVKDILSLEQIEMALRKGEELGMLRSKKVQFNQATAYIAQARAVKALDVAEIEDTDFIKLWKRQIPRSLYNTESKVKWRAPWIGREIIVQWDGDKEAYKAVVQVVQGWNLQLNRPVCRRKKQKSDGHLKIQYTLDGIVEEIDPESLDWYFAKPGQFSKHYYKKLESRGTTLDFLGDESARSEDTKNARKRSRQELEKSDGVDSLGEAETGSDLQSPMKKRKLEEISVSNEEPSQLQKEETTNNMGTDEWGTVHINDNVLFRSSTTGNHIYYGFVVNMNASTKEYDIQVFRDENGHCPDRLAAVPPGTEDEPQTPIANLTEMVKQQNIVKVAISNDEASEKACKSCGRYFEEPNGLKEHLDKQLQ